MAKFRKEKSQNLGYFAGNGDPSIDNSGTENVFIEIKKIIIK
jgi:hypothetical protein